MDTINKYSGLRLLIRRKVNYTIANVCSIWWKHGTIERCTSFAGSNSRLKTTGIKNFKMSGSATLFVMSSSLAPSTGLCGCSNKSNSLRLWKELQRPESSRADEFECNPLNGVRLSDTAPQISFLHVAHTSRQKSLPTRLLGTWCMLIATIIP